MAHAHKHTHTAMALAELSELMCIVLGTYNWQASETLFRCTECRFDISYVEVCMSPTTFSSTGTPLHKGGGVRPSHFFRLAAYRRWVELSISTIRYGTGSKKGSVRFGYCLPIPR